MKTNGLDFDEMFGMTKYDSLSDDLKEFVKSTSFFTIDEFGFVVNDEGNVTIDQIEEQKTYYETGEL